MEPGALAPSSPTGQAAPSAIESSEAACGELASPDAITATQTTLARATDEGDPVILVVHASVGSGHRSAAYAIAEAIQNAGERARAGAADPALPAGLDPALAARARVEVLDILDFGRIVFDGDATASMFTGWTRPFYDITWRYVLTGRLLWGGGTIWAHLMYPRFVEFARQVRPAAIVATISRRPTWP